jgi:hypothetical protein
MASTNKHIAAMALCLAFGFRVLAWPPPQDAAQRRSQAREILLRARALLSEYSENSRANPAGSLAGLQVLAGDVTAALETANELTNPSDRSRVLCAISRRLGSVGDTAQALSLLESAEDGQTKAQSYSSIATSLALRGDLDGARRVSGMIHGHRDYQAGVLALVARAQIKAGDAPAAEKTVAEALVLADLEHRGNPDPAVSVEPEILASTLRVQDDVGNQQAAERTLKRLRLLVAQGQPPNKDALLMLLARTQASRGEASDAAEIAQQISIEPEQGNSTRQIPAHTGRFEILAEVATAAATAGDFQQALEIAAGIPDVTMRAYALGNIAEWQFKRGYGPAAQETLGLISDSRARVFNLARIASELATMSDSSAGTVLQLAEDAAKLRKNEPRAVYGFLADAQAKLGDYKGAQELLAKLGSGGAVARSSVAGQLAKTGDLSGALSIVEEERSINKFNALLAVARGLLSAIDKDSKNIALN